jgi:hypothetical protein
VSNSRQVGPRSQASGQAASVRLAVFAQHLNQGVSLPKILISLGQSFGASSRNDQLVDGIAHRRGNVNVDAGAIQDHCRFRIAMGGRIIASSAGRGGCLCPPRKYTRKDPPDILRRQ